METMLGVMGTEAEPEYPPELTDVMEKTLLAVPPVSVQEVLLVLLGTRYSLSLVVISGSCVRGLLLIVKRTA